MWLSCLESAVAEGDVEGGLLADVVEAVLDHDVLAGDQVLILDLESKGIYPLGQVCKMS